MQLASSCKQARPARHAAGQPHNVHYSMPLARPHHCAPRFGADVAMCAIQEPAAAVATADAAVVAVSPARTLSRKCTSKLPPLGEKVTELTQLSAGVWMLQQQFIFNDHRDLRSNAFVLQLPNGQLLLTSASISLTEEARSMFASLPGPIHHIVCNSSSVEHWMYAGQYIQELWPEATVWACPDCDVTGRFLKLAAGTNLWEDTLAACKRKNGSSAVRFIEHGTCPPELDGAVNFSVFNGITPLASEATIHVPSKQLIVLADIGTAELDLERVRRSGDPTAEPGMRLFGIWGKLGAGFSVFALLLKRAAGRRWRDMVASWEWDTILCSHLSPVINKRAREQFKEAYAFLG